MSTLNFSKEKSDIFNYFKIFYIYKNLCKPLLTNIFKDRWSKEHKGNDSQWQSTTYFGSLLASKIKGYMSLIFDDKELIDNGKLERWSIELLLVVLKKLKFNNLNIEDIQIENKEISTIESNYLKLIKLKSLNQFYLNDAECDEMFTQLKNAILKLEPLNSIKDYDINTFKEQDIIDEAQQNESNKDLKKPIDIERINEFINSGDKLFENGDYKKANEKYNNALYFFNSKNENIIYSKIMSNKCLVFLKIFQTAEQNSINDLKNARNAAIESICSRVSWYRGYYVLGKYFQIAGQYEMSIKCYDTSLQLDSTRQEIIEDKKLVSEKLSSRILGPNGKRDLKKEDEKFIDSFDFSNFNNIVSEIDENSLPLIDGLTKDKLDKFSKKYNLPENFLFYKACDIVGLNKFQEKDYKTAFKYLIKAASYGFPNSCHCLQYYYLQGREPSIPKNTALSLALLYKSLSNSTALSSISSSSSSLNVNIKTMKIDTKILNLLNKSISEKDQGIEINSKNMVTHSIASIFKNGYYGNDIDIEKAIHYYELSIKNYYIESCSEYGILLHGGVDIENGFPFIIEKDEFKALLLIKSASVKGDQIASNYLKNLI